MTSFSDSLVCMDQMLRQEHLPQTLIASKFIIDASNGKASVSAKDMVITALSQMSRTSNAFRVVDFEIDPLRQDTVQTLTSVMLPGGQMQIPRPELYVSGAISYVDQNILNRNMAAGVSHQDWEIGASDDIITTAIGMELHIGDFNSRTLFPGIDSSNEITAANKAVGFDAGARIKKAGVQFSFGSTTSQGAGPAVRTLIDLGMIELIGKWAKVPYWQCLSLDQAHPEFQRQLLDWFSGMDIEERIRFFQTGLRSLGYYQGEVDGRSSPALKAALLLFQTDTQATPSGNVNFESYERLMTNYVVSDGTGEFMRVGWSESSGKETDMAASDAKFADTPRAGWPFFHSGTPMPVNVEITLDRREPEYNLGEALLLNVSVDRHSYLSCFYQDSKGSVAQIYPSVFQPPVALQANRSVVIPDILNPYSFAIEMTTPGPEAVACFTSSSDISVPLAEGLGAMALESIPDVSSIEMLAERVGEVAGEKITGANAVYWTVIHPF